MTNGCKLPAGLPPIKRCREYHLYDYQGNRYLDLYLDGGRALMGHKPGKTMLPLKNSLEKGIWAPYPTVYSSRLDKLLKKLFPPYAHHACFSNRERMEQALGEENLSRSVFWIPLLDQEADCLILRPLVPGIDQTHIVLSSEPLSSGDMISPVLLEGIIRNFHDYELFREREDFSLWTRFDTLSDWERKGPCLFYRGKGNYRELTEKALDAKVLLPASKEQPAILPSRLSSHEMKTLMNLLAPEEGGPT